MPYSAQHKLKTRKQIIETARVLFNRHGFEGVTIDRIMEEAGLTRGGFYNHFKSKEALYSESVSSFLMGRGAVWRTDAGIDPARLNPHMARQMVLTYLSSEHLGDIDGQCPMIALPSDVARANAEVQSSYQTLLEAMVGLFETGLGGQGQSAREDALSLAALCVGGMILARTLPDSELAQEVQNAALKTSDTIMQNYQ
ncbi:TetR/AcrR family transcriptional regulator [Sphingorhabdus sp. Alg239-R122]|uniref:TetR/AcrR family transcriptional regulator n=1 Tax=Sphingorhabdus sp. Alg239-R122 TaxID=2305989 RepID=UPI0013DB554E|nr:TetR/AcrR family transcriptional regulator [Sphingorhabdus sp. Alg239-R122]